MIPGREISSARSPREYSNLQSKALFNIYLALHLLRFSLLRCCIEGTALLFGSYLKWWRTVAIQKWTGGAWYLQQAVHLDQKHQDLRAGFEVAPSELVLRDYTIADREIHRLKALQKDKLSTIITLRLETGWLAGFCGINSIYLLFTSKDPSMSWMRACKNIDDQYRTASSVYLLSQTRRSDSCPGGSDTMVWHL